MLSVAPVVEKEVDENKEKGRQKALFSGSSESFSLLCMNELTVELRARLDCYAL